MAVITLVCRENAVAALNALTAAQDGPNTFRHRLATQANPAVAVARWCRWDTRAFASQASRPKDGAGDWNLHHVLAADARIGAQIADQGGWGVDDSMQFNNAGTILLIAYKNWTKPAIRTDLNVRFGVTLVPWSGSGL